MEGALPGQTMTRGRSKMIRLDATPDGGDWIKTPESVAEAYDIPWDEFTPERFAERTGMTLTKVLALPVIQQWLRRKAEAGDGPVPYRPWIRDPEVRRRRGFDKLSGQER